jgi:diguanylate cyclase (GGDEF)-like protein
LVQKLHFVMLGLVFVFGGCIIAMIAFLDSPVSEYYYVGIILVLIGNYAFAQIRFRQALVGGLGLFIAYEYLVLIARDTPREVVLNNTFFFFGANYVGMFACYALERHRRQVFLQRAELARLTSQLQDLSMHDPLTGLYNRRQLASHLRQECERHHREGTPAAVMLLDLDDFKAVNDRYGHLAGDELLRRTARAIGATVRGSDISFRYGGDEFLVLLPDTTLEQAEELARRLVARMSQFGASSATFEDAPGISVGVAAINDDIATPDDLLHAADRALYRAKLEGKGRVMVSGASP